MKNIFASELLEQIHERFSDDSLNMSMSEWVTRNTTLKNRPFSIKGYEFQRQILDDMHENMDVIKISQVGITEIQIRKALGFLKRHNGTTGIFSLPNEDMYKRVSNARIKPIVNHDKVFNTSYDKQNKATRSMDLMQFGQSFLYIVPAIESAATSIDADFVLNDEIDLSDQKMLSLFISRLQNSKHRINQRFSTPTFPSFSVDLNWKSSDQHHFMCRCSHCNHVNHPEFTRNHVVLPGAPDHIEKYTDITEEYKDVLDLENAYVKCENCHRPLDMTDPDQRFWLPYFPTRKGSRGYRIGPFSSTNLDIKYIMTAMWRFYKTEYKRGFFNTVLGQPYSDGNIQIPEEDIKACMDKDRSTPVISNTDSIWLGIDVGQICHVVWGKGESNDLDIVKMETVRVNNLIPYIEDVHKNYRLRGGAIDRHPYTPTADEIFRITEGKIVPVEYRGQKDTNIVKDSYGEINHCQVNRTWFLDNLATKIRKRLIKIQGFGYQERIVIDHFRDMVRDETPEKPADWVKLSGNDHYFHASAFMEIGPHLQDIIRLNSKEEIRTMAFGVVSSVKDNASNLIGFSKQKKM